MKQTIQLLGYPHFRKPPDKYIKLKHQLFTRPMRPMRPMPQMPQQRSRSQVDLMARTRGRSVPGMMLNYVYMCIDRSEEIHFRSSTTSSTLKMCRHSSVKADPSFGYQPTNPLEKFQAKSIYLLGSQ
jgi:hypothetical protein